MNKNDHKNCPVARVALLLSDPWTILIIRDLLIKKKMKFSDFEKSLKGISSRTLTIKLKNLEKEGLIYKEDLHYYVMTNKGLKFKKILKAMADYGKNIVK